MNNPKLTSPILVDMNGLRYSFKYDFILQSICEPSLLRPLGSIEQDW